MVFISLNALWCNLGLHYLLIQKELSSDETCATQTQKNGLQR